MKTVTLNIDHLVKAKRAIDKLLSQPGLDRKKVYWLARNRDKLDHFVKDWFTVIVPSIQKCYMEDIPQTPFVPMSKYGAFKKELSGLVSRGYYGGDPVTDEEMGKLFTKHEVVAKEKQGIPAEKGEEYQKQINEAVIAFEKEVEYQEIVIDKILEILLTKLTGEEVVAIEFMLEEPSPLELNPGAGGLKLIQ